LYFYLISLFFVFFFTGMVRCVTVQQNPTSMLANKTESAVITCSHDDNNMDYMLWYQQKDTAMVLIVFNYGGDPSYEDEFKGRFKLDRTATVNGVLKISNLSLSDSAVYYCAVSMHTHIKILNVCTLRKAAKTIFLYPPTEKEKVTLVCVAENFYPDHVSIKWTLGDKEITEDVATDPYATKDENTKMFNISSRLKVSKKEFTPKNTFRCTVTFNNSTHVSEKTVYITGTGGISLDIS
uniref:Ig-like domain-containing protein n=1 Tax=Cyprinus carpio carpio TaxID=630221 RepID=A0A9J8BCA6_CYPCA